MKTKAVIYCRFSPRPSAAECQSNEVQLAACRKYCTDRGYTIVGEFSDAAASGDDAERVGLWDAVAAVPRGGLLIVHKLDRLARSVTLDGYIRHKLSDAGASIEAADGTSRDDSPEAVLMRQVLAALAEYQKQISAARTRAAMLHAQHSGRAMSKLPPYGWRREGKRLELEPLEQAAIGRIVSMRAAGLTYRAIARQLDADGSPCRGQKWGHSLVVSICRRNFENSASQSCTA